MYKLYCVAKLPSLIYHELWHFLFIWIFQIKVEKIEFKCDIFTGEFKLQFWLNKKYGIKVALVMIGPLIGMIVLLLISWKFIFPILLFWKGFYLSSVDKQTFLKCLK